MLQVGFGPLGQKIYEMTLGRETEQVVGVIDVAKELRGRDAGSITVHEESGVIISDLLEDMVRMTNPDVAVITTVSDMKAVTPLIERVVRLGLPVVSTCEELSYPWETSHGLAQRIDTCAAENGVAVLGTGVNPGFLMDSLPAFLTAVCSHVEKVEVLRYQDAQFRRLPFQKKIGAGLSLADFEIRKREGTLRHVGLTESIRFIADRFGWKLDRVEDIISPVVARSEVRTPALTIPIGYATGVRQVGSGYIGETEKVRLVFQASVGEPEHYDEVQISGNPYITSRIKGGVNGDIATCAITLNAIRSVLEAKPGLRTMSDVPMVTFHA